MAITFPEHSTDSTSTSTPNKTNNGKSNGNAIGNDKVSHATNDHSTQSHKSSTSNGDHPHIKLEDNPPIASLDDGGEAVDPGRLTEPVLFRYEVVQGHFIQNGPKPKHISFDKILNQSFGLIDTSPQRWHNLRSNLASLNDSALPGVNYKVLFLGRHGQGWHNHAVTKHGVADWEAKWTFLNTDGELTWGPDPALTPLGEAQAAGVYEAWKREERDGAPVRGGEMRWLVSPMRRACQTMLGSFGEFIEKAEQDGGRQPEMWEDWREITGSHTCDKRSDKTTIRSRFPNILIEPSLEEDDIYWKADDRESRESMQIRGRRALDRVFNEAEESFISITSHSEFFRNFLAVLDHQPYPLSTGEMIPVVVKATKVDGSGSGGDGP